MSITKVGKNKYRIFISDGFNLDGTRRRFTKTITTDLKGRDLKKFLMQKELEFEEEVKKRDPKFNHLTKGTFEAYSIWWLKYIEVSEKTREWYGWLLNTWILPYISNKVLEKITTGDMLELMEIIKTTPSPKTKETLSVRSVKHIHTLLKNMFNTAIELKILKENPMNGVNVKSPETQLKDNYYNLEDINKLLSVLPTAPIKYQLATLLTLSTGLRLGELSGLQWKHIDKTNCIVTVEQSNSYANKNSKIKETKTSSSNRKVSFPHSLIELIEKHEQDELKKKEILGAEWYYGQYNPHSEDFVFTQKNGKVIFVDTISDWWRKFRRENNLKNITFHGLRHTSTTILIASGINVKNISSRLGHSRASTTTDFYAHALESVEKESANVFDNIISGTQSGTQKTNLKVVK